MDSWQKIKRFLNKVFSGKPVISSLISKDGWDKQYKKGSWDRLTDSVPPNSKRIAEYCFAKSKELNRSISIVDLGCGNGGLAIALLEENVPVKSYVGVDVSEEALVLAEKNFSEGKYYSIDLSKEVPREVGAADVVVCNEVIYYVPITPFLKRLKKKTTGSVVFSYYRSWRSMLIGMFIFLYFGSVKRYSVETDSQKWSIDIYEQGK